MISYNKLWKLLEQKGFSSTYWTRNQGINPRTISRMKRGEAITTKTIDDFCRILECQPGEILSYECAPQKPLQELTQEEYEKYIIDTLKNYARDLTWDEFNAIGLLYQLAKDHAALRKNSEYWNTTIENSDVWNSMIADSPKSPEDIDIESILREINYKAENIFWEKLSRDDIIKILNGIIVMEKYSDTQIEFKVSGIRFASSLDLAQKWEEHHPKDYVLKYNSKGYPYAE